MAELFDTVVKDSMNVSSHGAMFLESNQIRGGLKKYEEGLELIYRNVNHADKDLIISLMAYRALGFTKVKLSRNNKEYWQSIAIAKTLKCSEETYDPHFMHFILGEFDLNPIGYDIKSFFAYPGIAICFIIRCNYSSVMKCVRASSSRRGT